MQTGMKEDLKRSAARNHHRHYEDTANRAFVNRWCSKQLAELVRQAYTVLLFDRVKSIAQ